MLFSKQLDKTCKDKQNHIDTCNTCRDTCTYTGDTSCQKLKKLNAKENMFEWLDKLIPVVIFFEAVGFLFLHTGIGDESVLFLGLCPVAMWTPVVWDDIKDVFK